MLVESEGSKAVDMVPLVNCGDLLSNGLVYLKSEACSGVVISDGACVAEETTSVR
jgi:hypothetical protein